MGLFIYCCFFLCFFCFLLNINSVSFILASSRILSPGKKKKKRRTKRKEKKTTYKKLLLGYCFLLPNKFHGCTAYKQSAVQETKVDNSPMQYEVLGDYMLWTALLSDKLSCIFFPGAPQALLQSCVTFGAFSCIMEGLNKQQPALALSHASALFGSNTNGGRQQNVLPPFTLPLPRDLMEGFSSFCSSLSKDKKATSS